MAYQTVRWSKNFPRERSVAASAGAIAGLISGAAMGLLAMIYSASIGEGFTFPLKEIAATFLGVEAIIGGAGTIILGALIHFAVSAAWGAIFGMVLPRDRDTLRTAADDTAAYGWGLAFGVGVWLVMTFIALPVFNQVMSDRVALYSGMWFINHLLFGVVLGTTPAIARRMGVTREVYYESTRRAA